MTIWVDADACPKIIKEILLRAAIRTKTTTVFVANCFIATPPSVFIKTIQVPLGFDIADNQIIKKIERGDLIVTADIPLADAAVTLGAIALNPRGELYTSQNIKQRISIRNFGESLRSSGISTGGPSKINKKNIQAFANCLDQYLNNQPSSDVM